MNIGNEFRKLQEETDFPKYDKVVEYFESHMEDSTVSWWNMYCADTNCYDDQIFPLDENNINEFFSSPYDALRAGIMGEVSFNDPYFRLNGYGNIVTGYPEDFIDVDALSKYCIDNRYSLLDNRLSAFIDSIIEGED